MIRFLLNTLNCILLFVQLILAIIAIVAITNISKDASGSVAVIVISLILVIPIGFIMHYISKKTKVNSPVKEIKPKEVPSEQIEKPVKRRVVEDKPSDIIDYDTWCETDYVAIPNLPEGLHGFELNEKLNAKIATYRNGVVEGVFYFERIFESYYKADKFYIQVTDSKGDESNVGFSKILSVNDGDFVTHLLDVFYKSDVGRAEKLVENFKMDLYILLYLASADTSLTLAKKHIICDYLTSAGADCSETVLTKASKKVNVSLQEFKRCANAYSKLIDENLKSLYIATAEAVVGGREKAKPFGLAGLTYIDSKMKA